MFKQFSVLPVGWGSANVLEAFNGMGKRIIVLTDGGALPSCLGRVHPDVMRQLMWSLPSRFFKVWIISHFDYDHLSIASLILKYTRSLVDICVLPYVYEIDECRRAQAYLYYLKMKILGLTTLPEAVYRVLQNCRKFWLARRGRRVVVDRKTYYEILWPTLVSEKEVCAEIAEVLEDKLGKTEVFIDGVYEQLVKRLKEDTIDVDVLDLEKQAKKGSTEPVGYVYPSEVEVMNSINNSVLLEKQLSNRYLDIKELAYATRSILNVFSIAYAIRHFSFFDYLVNVVDLERDSNQFTWRVTPDRLLRPSTPVLYLADLDRKSLRLALSGTRLGVPVVVIAAHHGNAWHDKIKGHLSYIPTCLSDVPPNYVKDFVKYCSSMPCIIGEHRIGVRLDFT